MTDAQLAGVVGCLNRHGVRYVVIGGAAAQLHGAPIPRTRDADVVPDPAPDNLERLAAALHELDARLWVGASAPEGLAMAFDRDSLATIQTFLNLVTQYGPLDITHRPDGTDGYADLARAVTIVELLGEAVPVAALRDVIRSKEAAGRPKDRAVLPVLLRTLQRRRA